MSKRISGSRGKTIKPADHSNEINKLTAANVNITAKGISLEWRSYDNPCTSGTSWRLPVFC